jgi:hypothetical protein
VLCPTTNENSPIPKTRYDANICFTIAMQRDVSDTGRKLSESLLCFAFEMQGRVEGSRAQDWFL